MEKHKKLSNKAFEDYMQKLTNKLYPWEILEQEREHPDDLEDNIYF